MLTAIKSYAQYNEPYKPQTTRILIVLDGSGSMKDKFGDINRWEAAKEILFKTIDSVQRKNKQVEFGIRIFGHQSKHSEKNCKDSKLEVPFEKLNAKKVKETLSSITPQGWTPIAYSLEQAANDFVGQPNIQNAIILITDGLETCNGDICAAGKALQDKRITLKPYVIGLGLAINEQKFFDCVGKYFDVVDAPQFLEILNATISQSLNPTTTQINLLNAARRPVETDVALTIYDSHTKQMLYNFIHALDSKGLPDTLRLDPKGRYDIVAHTIPPVRKNEIELTAGMHNIIAIETPQGTIKISTPKQAKTVQAIIKQSKTGETLYVQETNTNMKYLAAEYDVEVLTLPRIIYSNISLAPGAVKDIEVPMQGTLNVNASIGGVGGIFLEREGKLERVFEYKQLKAKEIIDLLPGKYVFVYRQANVYEAVYTKKVNFEINAGVTTMLRF
jgi:Ca-activated chloride channel family protein